MEQETRQRKPYNRVQCKLIDFGRNSTMFAVSWSDQCGLTPQGMATYKNVQYQLSLSPQALYQYRDRIERENGWTGTAYQFGDYPCLGYFVPGSMAPTLQDMEYALPYYLPCMVNVPYYQNLPNDGSLVNIAGCNHDNAFDYTC